MSNPTTDKAMTKAPKTNAQTIQGWMQNSEMQRAIIGALAGYMNPEQFAAAAFIAAQNPDLAKCDPRSLFKSILECASMGLSPNPAHKHVAFIPRAGAVTVMPQWQGLQSLMLRQPGIKDVQPRLVHVTDTFAATPERVTEHSYDPLDDARFFEHPDTAAKNNRKSGLKGGYVEIHYDTGEVRYHFMTLRDMEQRRLCARQQDFYLKWPAEMYRKCLLRDVFSKRVIPIATNLQDAVALAVSVEDAPAPFALPQGTRTEQLAAALSDAPDMAGLPSPSDAVVEEAAPTP